MKKSILAVMLLLNMSVFAKEVKPDILDDYKIMVGMIDDLHSDMNGLKEKQDSLEKTFSNIRVVKKENDVTSSLNEKHGQLEEETRKELQNNLR